MPDRFSSDSNNFDDNWYYNYETSLNNVYQRKANYFMLDKSLTYRCEWNDILDRTDFINRGINRYITESYLNRLSSIIEIGPNVCFIIGGINYLFQGEKLSIIRLNIDLIIDTLLTHKIGLVLQSVLPVGEIYEGHTDMNNQITILNNDIKGIYQKRNLCN